MPSPPYLADLEELPFGPLAAHGEVAGKGSDRSEWEAPGVAVAGWVYPLQRKELRQCE